MSVWWAWVAVAGSVAAALAALVVVRRWAPPGGHFTDTARAAGVFTVLGTVVAVLLAFVIFLALETFSTAKETAGQEAVATTQLYRTAALLPDPGGSVLRGELVCYARAVVEDEWRTMSDGRESPTVHEWLDRMASSISSISPENEREATAYGEWFDQDAERREGRRGRLAQAEPFVPALVWAVLVIGVLLVIVHAVLFADAAERVLVQAVMVGGITAVLASGLLVVSYLDSPYGERTGAVEPTEMRFTLELIEETRTPDFASLRVPCDDRGMPDGAEALASD
jgi:Protein of unknown function (DUF4239)